MSADADVELSTKNVSFRFADVRSPSFEEKPPPLSPVHGVVKPKALHPLAGIPKKGAKRLVCGVTPKQIPSTEAPVESLFEEEATQLRLLKRRRLTYNRYECRFCMKVFFELDHYNSHEQAHLAAGDKPYSNEAIREARKKQEKKKQAMETAARPLEANPWNPSAQVRGWNFVCPRCSLRCTGKEAFDEYVVQHKGKSKTKVSADPSPNKVTPQLLLERRPLTYRGYECRFCMEVFSEACKWASHEQTHLATGGQVPKHPMTLLDLLKAGESEGEKADSDGMGRVREPAEEPHDYTKAYPLKPKIPERYSHVQMKNFDCFICSLGFPSPTLRTSHEMQEHREEFALFQLGVIIRTKMCKCAFCEEKFFTKTEKTLHEESQVCQANRSSKQRPAIRCPSCDKVFFTGHEREAHVTHRHAKVKTTEVRKPLLMLSCCICPQLFHNKAAKSSHETAHFGPVDVFYRHVRLSRNSTVSQCSRCKKLISEGPEHHEDHSLSHVFRNNTGMRSLENDGLETVDNNKQYPSTPILCFATAVTSLAIHNSPQKELCHMDICNFSRNYFAPLHRIGFEFEEAIKKALKLGDLFERKAKFMIKENGDGDLEQQPLYGIRVDKRERFLTLIHVFGRQPHKGMGTNSMWPLMMNGNLPNL